ncbi:VOC family protein [Tessaracoccus sp. ZS01]|uniref:VOC family protein n=1 Tax=Tessaracoccus sp. ZS01 TaxID=1906324 RepID=UPI00096E1478|nr:VOC family protein [Tessaracoccus sp. ZS01]MCG6568370.1 glyoxalase [Tessaracoccus sp. ZS01]OMG52778.1 glyoxalase [Tessaracoccus sp. ZS01]
MSTKTQLVVDCHSPTLLLPFWAAALDYVPATPPEGHDSWRDYYLAIGEPEESLGDGDCCDRLVDPTERGPAVWFQVVPESKSVKNRLHLDLFVTDGSLPWAERREQLEDVVARLTALGGTIRTPIPSTEAEHFACGINDPEGNEFCLV